MDVESVGPRRAPGRWLLLAACLGVALLLLAGSVADLVLDPSPGRTVTGSAEFVGGGQQAGTAASRLKVRGKVVDGQLLPGVARTLRITMRSGYSFPLSVQSARGVALQPAAAGCSAAWVKVKPFRAGKRHPGVRVPAGGRAKLLTRVTLVNRPLVNQDACKGVTFRLSLKVSVRRA